MNRGPNMGGLQVHLKERQILRQWADHKRIMQDFKDTCFKLLAHPDATAEEIDTVRKLATALHERHTNMLNLLRSKGFNAD